MRFLLLFLLMLATGSSAAQVLDSPEAFGSFCELSEHKDTGGPDRLQQRKARVSSPIVVRTTSRYVTNGTFNPVTQMLTYQLGERFKVLPNHGVAVMDPIPIRFELSESMAMDLNARFALGHVRLEVAFLPVSYAEFEKSFCEQDGSEHWVLAHLLNAKLIDEMGNELSAWTSHLGHNVRLMQKYKLPTFLGTSVPHIHVARVVFSPALSPVFAARVRHPISDELETLLFPCYVRGLSTHPRLQGAIVVSWKASDATSPKILVNSIHHEATTSCITKRLSMLAERRLESVPEGTSVTATIFMKLDRNNSL